MSLPAADDLFRATPRTREQARRDMAAVPDPSPELQDLGEGGPAIGSTRRPSGRVRHDEKMTVYVTSDELLDLEDARLSLRRDQGLAVDRGRLVREAIAIALADLEANGSESVLVQRLTGP